jgi:hypothetical protein
MSMQRPKNYVIIALVVAVIVLTGTVGFLYGKNTNLTTETVTQTTTTTLTVTSMITSTSTVKTSTSTVTSNITSDSYTFSPSTPLKILSVWAVVAATQNGERYITFYMEFENVVTSAVYIVGGCGSGVDLYAFTNSSVLQKIPGGPLCLCPEFIMPLSYGQKHTSITPGCWSGYAIKLLGSGKATVNFVQYWSNGSSGAQNKDSTIITASFTFP